MDLAALVLLESTRALVLLLVHSIALVLTIAGWRPAGADAPIEAAAVQMHQEPLAPAEPDPLPTTVVQLRARCREMGLPSRLWKSARRTELLALVTS